MLRGFEGEDMVVDQEQEKGPARGVESDSPSALGAPLQAARADLIS